MMKQPNHTPESAGGDETGSPAGFLRVFHGDPRAKIGRPAHEWPWSDWLRCSSERERKGYVMETGLPNPGSYQTDAAAWVAANQTGGIGRDRPV